MTLEQLRARLAAIDRQVIDLVAERQMLSREIGAVKRDAGRATRDFGREKQVIDAARRHAHDVGVPPGIAEDIITRLIRSSLTTQEQARVRAEGVGKGKPALIIGGAGKMGGWFAEFLDSQGFKITVADPAGPGPIAGRQHVVDWQELPDHFALTVVAAPLGVSAGILAAMAKRGWNGLVFDVGSLKSPLVPALRALAARGCRVASVHPMFGPDTVLLSGRHVVFMDVGQPQAVVEARQLFASTMARQIEMPLEEHDRLIAYVLGLSHALNVAFSAVLAESGEAAPRLAKLSSTTFDAQLDVASRVVQENPRLYFEIQSLNPHGLAALEELLGAVERLARMVRSGDEQAFVRLMEHGRHYLAQRG